MAVGKVTAAARARILALREEGKSYRAIESALEAEGIVLSRQTVSDVIKGAAEEQERAIQEQVEARAGAAVGRGGAATSGPQGLQELPAHASAAARALYERIRMLGEEIAEVAGEVRDGDTDRRTELWDLVMKETKLIEKLHPMLPEAQADPASDPTNERVREMLLAHVRSSVEAVEQRVGLLCPRCLRERA